MLLKSVFLLAAFLVLPPLQAWSAKVAVLASYGIGPYAEIIQGITKQALFEYEVVNANGDAQKAALAAKAISTQGVSAVIAIGDMAIKASETLPKDIPVIYTMVYEPIKMPGRPTAGVLLKISMQEQLSRIHQMMPERKRVGIVFNPGQSGSMVNEARTVADSIGVQIYALPVETLDEVKAALARLTPATADCILMVVDSVSANPEALQLQINHAAKENLPLFGLSTFHIKQGAFAAFTLDFVDLGAQVTETAKKLIQKEVAGPMAARKIVIYLNTPVQRKSNIAFTPILGMQNYQ